MKKLLLNQANLDVSKFAHESGEKGSLHGVHVTSKCTEASNGKYAIRVSMPEVESDDFPEVPGHDLDNELDIVLPLSSIKQIKIPKKSKVPILRNVCLSKNNTNHYLTTTDLENMNTIDTIQIEGTFPDVDKCIPAEEPTVEFAVSAKYLRDICDYAAKHTDETNKIIISVINADKVIKIKFKTVDEQDCTCLLIPMKKPG